MTDEIQDLERYLQRTAPVTPVALDEAAPPPQTWTGTRDQWWSLTADARRSYQSEAIRKFCLAVANGWYASELADGSLTPGSQLDAAGRVVRPLPSSISPELERAAARALEEMRASHISINPILEGNLEHAALGVWHGETRAIDDAIREARAAIARRRAEIEAAMHLDRAKVTLRVYGPFRATAGRSYSLGEWRIDPEEADELRLWQERMEAEQLERGWDAPVGFTEDTWPPFEIVNWVSSHRESKS